MDQLEKHKKSQKVYENAFLAQLFVVYCIQFKKVNFRVQLKAYKSKLKKEEKKGKIIEDQSLQTLPQHDTSSVTAAARLLKQPIEMQKKRSKIFSSLQ